MQEFQIFICNTLNKQQEKAFISDEQALAAYQEFYESHQKFIDETPTSNRDYFIQNHLIPLEGKMISYSEYKENAETEFNFKSWGLNKDTRYNKIWYMTKELKDDLIKCAELDKEEKQIGLDYLTSDYFINEIATEGFESFYNLTKEILKEQYDDCDRLIENLNYYYDRKMLLFSFTYAEDEIEL